MEATTKYFGFEQALKFLKEGKRVCRTGWNGKGMYLELQTPTELSKMTLPYIYIVMPGSIVNDPAGGTHTTPAKLVPWLASQTDLLSVDWDLIETQ